MTDLPAALVAEQVQQQRARLALDQIRLAALLPEDIAAARQTAAALGRQCVIAEFCRRGETHALEQRRRRVITGGTWRARRRFRFTCRRQRRCRGRSSRCLGGRCGRLCSGLTVGWRGLRWRGRGCRRHHGRDAFCHRFGGTRSRCSESRFAGRRMQFDDHGIVFFIERAYQRKTVIGPVDQCQMHCNDERNQAKGQPLPAIRGQEREGKSARRHAVSVCDRLVSMRGQPAYAVRLSDDGSAVRTLVRIGTSLRRFGSRPVSGRAGSTICYSVLNGHAGRVATATPQAREAADVRQHEWHAGRRRDE